MVSWKPCLIATAGYEYNCLVVHVTWYYTAYCIYVYTKAREDEFRELYRSYWRLAGLTDELWRTALVFTKSTSVKTGGQAPPLPNASYATAHWITLLHAFCELENVVTTEQVPAIVVKCVSSLLGLFLTSHGKHAVSYCACPSRYGSAFSFT